MDRYYELGGNCVDTARLYGNGKSEETIGKWIGAARRSGREVYVSTKGGHPRLESMNVSRVSKKEIEDDINESLAVLKPILSICIGCTAITFQKSRRKFLNL